MSWFRFNNWPKHEDLFDQGTPVPLRRHLSDHKVETAFERGWQELENGELLAAAERQFDLFITTDQNLRSQQNLEGRRIAVIVLLSTSWPRIRNYADAVRAVVETTHPGSYVEVPIP